MFRLSLLLVTFAMMLVSACGGDSDSSVNNSLLGTWSQGCESESDTPDQSVSISLDYKADLVVEAGARLYFDSNCSQIAVFNRLVGSYADGEELADGIIEQDVTITSSYLTISNQQALDNINSDGICDTDFVLNVEKQLTKETCTGDFVESVGETFYSSYKVEGGKLFLGDDLIEGQSGDTAEERSVTLEAESYDRQ